jgi:AbiV family abortive infection protein
MKHKTEIERIRSECMGNAAELLAAAKDTTKQPGRNHIAYHLATLALEEVGKSSMIFMSSLRAGDEDEERKRPVDWIDNHERKLFWAIWSLRLNKSTPWKGIQQAIDIASHIHQNRLGTLYVGMADPEARKRVSGEEVQNLLRLTEAQLELEKLKQPRDLSEEEQADMQWLFAATEDPYLKTIIFSKVSFEKQAEFGENGGLEWIRWLKQIIEENNQLNTELARQEINRVPPEGEAGNEDKWEITIRLKSWSHSIRQRPLTEWNKKVDKIKLSAGAKNELLVKFIVPKKITAQHLWQFGMHNSFLLASALNIGSLGFFWWYLPAFMSTYADVTIDLENKAKFIIERVPNPKVSWGNLVLTSETLTQVSIVFSHLAMTKEAAQQEVFQRYFKALSVFAKNDLFLPVEGTALVEFHFVLREALAAYGDWDSKDDTLHDSLSAAFQSLDAGTGYAGELEELLRVAALTSRGENKDRPVSLDDVVKLKVGCDYYLLMKARAHMRREIDALKTKEGAAVETT